jgi:hypothetical protein
MHRPFPVDQCVLQKNKIKSQNHLTVRLPNGATMESTHTASIDIQEFSIAVAIAYILPGMANHSFLSVGQLCNEGYSFTFKIDTAATYNLHGVQILRGAPDLDTGFWQINLREVLLYARSRNPTCAHAHTQRHIQAPRDPLNLVVCLRVCDMSQGRT